MWPQNAKTAGAPVWQKWSCSSEAQNGPTWGIPVWQKGCRTRWQLFRVAKCSAHGPVLRIRDVNPDPGPKRFPDPGSKRFPDLGSGSASASKNLSILTQKIVSKLPEIWSGMFFPDPDLDILPIPDPEVKQALDPGSWIRIRNTAADHWKKRYFDENQCPKRRCHWCRWVNVFTYIQLCCTLMENVGKRSLRGLRLISFH